MIRKRLREIIDNNTTVTDNAKEPLNKTCCDLIRKELIKIKSDYPDYVDCSLFLRGYVSVLQNPIV